MIQLVLKETVMNTVLDRLKSGKYFDTNFNPYSKEYLKEVLVYFRDNEKYEECAIIREIVKKRFNHESNFRNF